MTNSEQVLTLLKQKGPLVPNDIKKVVGGDTFIVGAMLSELSSRGSIKVSSVKKGGSPLYYVPGQEPKLENFIELHNPKDQKTISLLKEKKVLPDRSLELFERVSLRQIKDYAKELKVQTANGEMLFWRYYLVPEGEAIQLLKNMYNKKPASTPAPTVTKEEVVPKKEEQPKPEPVKAEPVKEEKIIERQPGPVAVKQPEKKSEPSLMQQAAKQEESQTKLAETKPADNTPFYEKLQRYFSENKITVLDENQLSKDREFEFTIEIPSAIGTMKMYCRARNKKKLNEGDVAPALLKAKQQDIPLLYLTNGEFTKKSLAIIEKEYTGITIKKF